jgi:hypothetical protein
MKNLIITIVFFMTIISYFGCYYDKEELLYPQVQACDTTNVTYSGKVVPFMNSYCIGCHGNSVAASSGGNIKLENYADIKSNINKVIGAITHANGYSAMPKGTSQLDNCKIAIINIWNSKGTPNN